MDLNTLLIKMVQQQASDLFITTNLPPSIKVHGEIKPCATKVLTPSDVKEIVFSCMNEHQKKEFLSTNECQYAIGGPNTGRFRVSAFVHQSDMGMVIRRIETEIPTPESLELPEILKKLICTKRGIILFAGATGTGKSTSLAALIGYRNQTTSGHIITIEDPIEYVHKHAKSIITQREVGVDTESFEVALKSTLRQAPDVILIGEIRTEESMRYALSFAETGHLVLATIHANNANQALDRIIHFFPHEIHDQVWADLSLNMKAIVAQQLVQNQDKKSRALAVEIMINSPLCADHIRRGEVHLIKQLMAKSTEMGMRTFDQALFKLFSQKRISYEDALRHSDSPNNLRLMIKMNNVSSDQKMGDVLKELKVAEEDLSETITKEKRPNPTSMFETTPSTAPQKPVGENKTDDAINPDTTTEKNNPKLSNFFSHKKTLFSTQKPPTPPEKPTLSIQDPKEPE